MKRTHFATRFVLVLLVLLLSSVLRGWRLEHWTGFGYDQERDAFLIRSILKERRLMLIGARSAPTGLYTGSLYLYLMAPFYWFFHLDPLGGGVFAVLSGVLTTAVLVWSGSKLISFRAGLIAAGLYATSMAMVEYDQTPWNPSLLMATSLVLVTSLVMARRTASRRWFAGAGLALGFAFHLHFAAFYLALFSFVVLPAVRPKSNQDTLLGFFAFLILFSPLVIFDLRHNFLLAKQLAKLLGPRSDKAGPFFALRFLDSAKVAGEAVLHAWIPRRLIALSAFVPLAPGLLPAKGRDLLVFTAALAAAGGVATAMTGAKVVPYYFMPLFPLAFLLLASSLETLFQAGGWRFLLAFTILFLSVGVNLRALESRVPSLGLWAKEEVVSLILERTGGRPFRLSVTADPGRDFGFDYLFAIKGVAAPREAHGPVYTVVVPNGLDGIAGDIVYEGVGVVFPHNES